MSPTVIDRSIEWKGPERGEVFSRTVAMQAWAGERVDVSVDRDAAALVIVDHEVRSVMLTGLHAVHVLRPGEEPGDIGGREFAARMHADLEDTAWLRTRARHLEAEAHVTFVSVGAPIHVEFGQNGPVPFDDRRRGAVAVEIEGVARLSVDDPVTFHDSFLARTEDLLGEDFERIVGALLDGGLAKVLEASADDVDAIEPDPATLAAHASDALGPHLARLGLGVEALEITRLETPAGIAPTAAADPAPLATPADRG